MDTTGTVILLCKSEVPEENELKNLILKDALNLESKFRLTYSMILSLLRQKEMRIQDFMQRSFFEHNINKENITDYKEAIEFLANKKTNHNLDDNYCIYCTNNIDKYYESCRSYTSAKENLSFKLETKSSLLKVLQPGRVLLVNGFNKTSFEVKMYPVMLLEPLNSASKDGVLVLSLENFYLETNTVIRERFFKRLYDETATDQIKKSQNFEKLIEKLKNFRIINVQLPFGQEGMVNLETDRNSTVVHIKFSNIEAITNKQFKITQSLTPIVEACSHFDTSFDYELKLIEIKENLRKSQLFNSLALDLFNYAESLSDDGKANDFGDNLVDYIKDFGLRDIEFSTVYDEYKKACADLKKFKCYECPCFNEHVN